MRVDLPAESRAYIAERIEAVAGDDKTRRVVASALGWLLTEARHGMERFYREYLEASRREAPQAPVLSWSQWLEACSLVLPDFLRAVREDAERVMSDAAAEDAA